MPSHPTYPTGGDAIAAWRALPAQTRRWCRETVRSGEPLTDLDLAPLVTGYGHAMVRRNRWLLGGAAVGVLALSGALAIWSAPPATVTRTAEVAIGLVILGCAGVILLRTGPHLRYRTLRFWGLAALEQAQFAAAPAVAEPAAAAGATTTEIRFHRTRLLSVTVAGWVVVLALTAFAGYRLATAESLSPGNIAFAALCVVLVLILVSDLLRQRQYLVDPAFVRLTPDGWDFPGADMRGDWSEVRGIEVRSGHAIGARRLVHPGMRVVVLQIDDAQRHADNAHPLRRREAQSDYRQYGSPAAFSVSYFFTIPVIDTLLALRRYTAAPIHWR